ncbi:hypothetical protein BDR04DRAFT_1123401 [Suillus decipiens]|nr:hypothetical protein BDR04DRAFT_1123401 [Suillus decipiens]
MLTLSIDLQSFSLLHLLLHLLLLSLLLLMMKSLLRLSIDDPLSPSINPPTFLLVQLLLDLLSMQCLLCWWYRISHIVIKGFFKVLRALLATVAHKRLPSHFGPPYGDTQLLAAVGFTTATGAAAAVVAMLHGPISEASHF